jgi:3-hydroxyacyl-CoA dehydrogenase
MQAFVANGIRAFYIKDVDGKQVVNPEALALVKGGDQPSTVEQVRTRALNALAQEARMMLDEGVVATAAEIDLCMLLGCGWPLHLGGILPYLDREGVSVRVARSNFHPAGVASLPK